MKTSSAKDALNSLLAVLFIIGACVLVVIVMLALSPEKAEPVTQEVRLTWTATGDDGSVGRVSGYDIRVTTDTLRQFTQWTPINVNPCNIVCDSAGQTVTVTFMLDMTQQVDYWFGLVSIDDVGNRSPVSNFTKRFLPDLLSPDRVTDLR